MLISAIVAAARNGVIGQNNQIPWHLPADFAWFKRNTVDHHIIMGRNCFESIGRPLPRRVNLVVTRNRQFEAEGVVVFHTIDEAIQFARAQGEKEAFIIGGGEIYRQTQRLWHRIYFTEVDLDVKGDTFFPEIDPEIWRETWNEAHAPDEKNAHAYTFRIYERLNLSPL